MAYTAQTFLLGSEVAVILPAELHIKPGTKFRVNKKGEEIIFTEVKEDQKI